MTEPIDLAGEGRAAALESAVSEHRDESTATWEPVVVTLLCNWCSYRGAEAAGGSRATIPPSILPVRLLCSSRADLDLVATALAAGADGVLVLGCHPGDCHYKTGNYQTLRRHRLATPILAGLGVDPDRVRLDWVSADEGERYAEIAREMVATVRDLGPVPREVSAREH